MSWITIINWGAWGLAAIFAAVILIDIIKIERCKTKDTEN
jgi:hypothetical protein